MKNKKSKETEKKDNIKIVDITIEEFVKTLNKLRAHGYNYIEAQRWFQRVKKIDKDRFEELSQEADSYESR